MLVNSESESEESESEESDDNSDILENWMILGQGKDAADQSISLNLEGQSSNSTGVCVCVRVCACTCVCQGRGYPCFLFVSTLCLVFRGLQRVL